MFEKEIQFITDFNLNKIKRLGSFFTLEDLTKAKIHPAIVQYISAEIDYLIYLDRQTLMQKSVFDYSGSEIAQHFLEISREIKKNKLLPYEEVKKIILQAVSFHLTYLLRPVWTLKKFIFDTTEVRSQEEVKLFFNYLYFYDYYKKIFLTILEKKQLVTISIYEFESLLEKIQLQLLEQQMKNVLENALIDMAEFLSTGEVSRTRLSIETLEIFLKDKKLHDHIFKIRKLLSVDPKQKFELSEIKAALFSSITIEREEEVIEEEAPAEIQKDEKQLDIFQSAEETLHNENREAEELLDSLEIPALEEPERDEEKLTSLLDETAEDELEPLSTEEEEIKNENTIEETEPFSPISEDEMTPSETEIENFTEAEAEAEPEDVKTSFEEYFKEEIEKIEAREKESFVAENDEEETPQPIEEFESEEESEPLDVFDGEEESKPPVEPDEQIEETDEPIEEESEHSAADDLHTETEADIFSYFTTKETMKIIGGIFNNDSLDFVNTLESIAECSHEDEADQILKDVFLSYRVNSVGKEAELLKEKVEQFFRDKEF